MVKKQIRDESLKKDFHDKFIVNNDIEYFQIEDVISDALTVLGSSDMFKSTNKKYQNPENENICANENEANSFQSGNPSRRLSAENLKKKEKSLQNNYDQSTFHRSPVDMSDDAFFDMNENENIRNNSDVRLKRCKTSNMEDLKLTSPSSFSSNLSLISIPSSSLNSISSRTSSPPISSSLPPSQSLLSSPPHSQSLFSSSPPHSQSLFSSSPPQSQSLVYSSSTNSQRNIPHINPLALIELSSHIQKKSDSYISKEYSSPNTKDSSSTSRESSSSLPSPRPYSSFAFEELSFSDLRVMKEASRIRHIEVSR